MNPTLISKLQKIMALTTSPIEGEAAAATAMLQQMLAKHNLDIADLEQRGAATAPSIEEGDHDLGKAAFKWKLDLAEAIATHFFCVAMVDRSNKTVRFIGRPDNVAAMKSLYAWLIDQIKRICSARRKDYLLENPHDHIDPLRWQVQFGVGIVSRLGERLVELRRKQQDEAGTGLILHHATEISDYLEKRYGMRADGQKTKWQRDREEKWAKEREEMEELKKTDIEAYYTRYPWERPVVETEKEKAKRLKDEANRQAAWDRKWKRQQERAMEREWNKTPEQRRKDQQSRTARIAGADAAKDVNLEPFLTNREEIG